MKNYFRHGDLIIEEISAIPSGLQKKEDNIILEGEATNHFHRTSTGTLMIPTEAPASDNNWTLAFLETETPTEITHEEHETIVLQPGKYKFYQQREYDEQEERAVID